MTFRLSVFSAALVAAAVSAQTPQGVVTRALEPAADDLARLNLVPHWRLYLPVENRGDSVVTVQPFGDEVFVQLQSGRLIAIQADANAKTYRKPGDVLWIHRPELRPGVIKPVEVGPTEVYVMQGQRLVILDRTNGKLKYSEELVSTAAAAPVADSFAVYVPLDNRRIVAYSHVSKVPGYRPPKPYEAPDPVHRASLTPEPADELSSPKNRSPSIAPLEILRPPYHRGTDSIDSSVSVGMLKTLRPPYREVDEGRVPSVGALANLRDVYDLNNKESVTRIRFLWELLAGGKLSFTPVLTSDPQVPDSERIHSSTGRIVFTALRDSPKTNIIQSDFFAEADISAPLTARGDDLYVATADSNFLDLSVRELRESALAENTIPRGKFTTGGPIFQKPVLTDDSVYVVGERWGLIRLKHGTLQPMWTDRLPDGRVRSHPNEDVIQLLSVSKNYVYALDRRGRLLVIDAVRGSTLSAFDVSEFTLPVTNYTNDRLYLAANSGLLLCLRDRQRVVPEYLLKPVAVPKKAAPDEPKPDMPPKEQPKFDVPPKKAPDVKKAADPKKEVEPKKAADPKKEVDPKKE